MIVQEMVAAWKQDIPLGISPRLLASPEGPVPDDEWEAEVRTAMIAAVAYGSAPSDAPLVREIMDDPEHPALQALRDESSTPGTWDGPVYTLAEPVGVIKEVTCGPFTGRVARKMAEGSDTLIGMQVGAVEGFCNLTHSAVLAMSSSDFAELGSVCLKKVEGYRESSTSP